MADKLRVAVQGVSTRRRLTGDLALRNDLLSNNHTQYLSKMISHVNPASPYLFFTSLAGSRGNMSDNSNSLFDVTTSTTGAEFIRIQEEIKEQKPFYVTDNSAVPDTLVAGQPFDVGLDFAVLDEGEFVKLWDDKTILVTISRQITSNSVYVTFALVGQVGETASGSLLSIGKPIHWGQGNTKGEGSLAGNTQPLDTIKKNIFVAPTVITRYTFSRTGSYASDEVFAFQTDRAMDGSEPMEFMTDLNIEFFRNSLASIDRMMMDSRSNFDPATMEVNGSRGVHDSVLPSYPGVRQQLDQATIQYSHPHTSSAFQSLNKLESIMQQIAQVWPGTKVLVIAEHGGMKWVRDTLIEGGRAKYNITYNSNVGGNGLIQIGYGIDKFISQDGIELLMYDFGKGYKSSGDFKSFTYRGAKGSDRSREIYFVPIPSEETRKKLKTFTYFTKSGNGIDRGMVYGHVRGLTGQTGGFTGKELMNMQDDVIKGWQNNSAYDLGTTRDGDQFELLFEGVPYIDIYGVIKMTLVD